MSAQTAGDRRIDRQRERERESQPKTGHGRKVTCVDANRSAREFLKNGGFAATACPSGEWIMEFAKADPSPGKEIIVIGCNKGDDFVRLMSFWDHTRDWRDPQKYVSKMEAVMERGRACGKLEDFSPPVFPPTGSHSSPRGMCVEPMKNTFNAVSNILTTLGYDRPYGGHDTPMVLVNAALSNSSEILVAKILDEPAGRENLGIIFGPNDIRNAKTKATWTNIQEVRLVSGDEIVREHGFQKADMMLFIDTEGSDALVLLGFRGTLSSGRVRYIEFEHHRKGDWRTRTLIEMIDYLDELNFECYWAMGKNLGLWRITGCYHAIYRAPYKWSNVACVNRNDRIWWPIMRKLDRAI